MSDEIKKAFQAKLKQLRQDAGLTQAQLAAKVDIPLGSLRDLEQGRHVPNWAVVVKLAAALNVDCTAFTETPGKKKK